MNDDYYDFTTPAKPYDRGGSMAKMLKSIISERQHLIPSLIASGLSLFMLNDLPHKTFWPWFNLAAS